jgi:hypothetical protein
MNKVVNLARGVDTRDLNATVTLQNILSNVDLKGFVIAGYTEDGEEFFSSTYADGGDALWLLERCKLELLRQVD